MDEERKYINTAQGKKFQEEEEAINALFREMPENELYEFAAAMLSVPYREDLP